MDLRKYKFNSKDDFIFYLREILVTASKNISYLENKLQLLKNYIDERNLIERPKRVISAEMYDDYKSTISNTTNYLSNLFGDASDLGISYRNYRTFVKKKADELNLKYLDFTQEQEELMNKITTARNWSSHIPASLINSMEERVLNKKVDINNPIFVPKFERYSGIWLVDLYNNSFEIFHNYKTIFEIAFKDYEQLIEKRTVIFEKSVPLRDISDLIIPKISSEIQHRNIKSTSEIQQKYIVSKKDVSNIINLNNK
ncbi:hypothetical protein [Bacillus subtilis]|uniref:hypothetical protein n=1 Tax=Bacillus subtilis TaxID=1423 RepID=UPI000D777FA6|nr:hypothetical protein [Bacillus subtilis]AWM23010.1 hypothetical protein DJ572_20630 [Bacillus subtilis]QAW14544.1 hypothetical protein ETA10_21650 [Bacillus subtilis]WBU34495.1 hypothetical protein OSK17_22260 [Bacillus subtilis]